MTKDEVFDLILKAMAIYLFVLAALSLPTVVTALLQLLVFSKSTLASFFGDATVGDNFVAVNTISAADGVIRFVVYILVGRNLFNGGLWARRILNAKATTQPNDAAVSSSHSNPPSPQ